MLSRSSRQIRYRDQLATISKRVGDRTSEPFWRLFQGQRGLVSSSEARTIKDVGCISDYGRGRSFIWFVGRLDGMETDGPVEESGGEEVWIARTPVNLESPVIGRGKLRHVLVY